MHVPRASDGASCVVQLCSVRRPRRRADVRPLMPYVAALATIVVLALLLSYAARRVMQPLSAG